MRYYFGQYVLVRIQWTDENGFIVLHLTIDASSASDHKFIILAVAASTSLSYWKSRNSNKETIAVGPIG